MFIPQVDTIVICAGQECFIPLLDPVKKAGNRVFLIGGAQEAGELDGKILLIHLKSTKSKIQIHDVEIISCQHLSHAVPSDPHFNRFFQRKELSTKARV